MNAPAEVQRDRWYPSPAPSPANENRDAYTNRLTGADKTNREPYDHRRNRQCSIGYHTECSERNSFRGSCECPCHADYRNSELQEPLSSAVLEEASQALASVYDLPVETGRRVIIIASVTFGQGGNFVALGSDISAAYGSRVDEYFADDVEAIYRHHIEESA